MPLQIPQLDDRSAEQLFAEAKARIPVHTPEWTNFNDSDPGITLVQLFAFMTENLLYRSNRIPEANRRKFLTLLGIGLQPASPGLGLVSFSNERGPLQPFPLDAGAELRAGKTAFRTRTALCILPVSAAVFYKKPRTDLDEATKQQYQLLYETFLDQDIDQLKFYQSLPLDQPETGKPLPNIDLADSVNGTIDRSLWVALLGPANVPISTVRAAIAGQTLAIGLYPAPQCESMVLRPETVQNQAVNDPGLIFEIAAPDPDPTDPTGDFGIGDPKYNRLNIEYAENVLEKPGVVQVTLPEYGKLKQWAFDPEEEGTQDYPPLVEDKSLSKRIVTWLRIRVPAQNPQSSSSSDKSSQQKAQVSWVGLNSARVIQAIAVNNERVGIGTGAPDQLYKVANTPVIIDNSVETAPGQTPTSTFSLQIQNIDGTWDTWQTTDDLYAAGPNDKVFTLDPESGQVSFGSGLQGMRPPLGQIIRASYEYGGGAIGKVAIGAINKSAALPGGFKVNNPVATWGAGEGEDVAAGERNISRYIKHRDRLVTASDFKDIALRTPGVDMGRVEILPLFNPEHFNANNPNQTWAGTVTVMVIPKYDATQPDAPIPDRLFLDAVCAWLNPRRLLTTEIYIRGPEYVPVWLSVGIVTMPGQISSLVRRDVQAALREYLSPLIGGLQVSASSLDGGCTDPALTTTDPCPKLNGVGWPLGVEVRKQDLEAVATRVTGVRYVDSIKLGAITNGATTLSDVDSVPMLGLQLPYLITINVNEGPAQDLNQPADPTATGKQVPVPVLPQKC